MANVVTRVVVDTEADTGELLKLLLDNYYEVVDIEPIARGASLPMAEITWQRPAVDVWPQVLQVAAANGRWDALVQALVNDPERPALRSSFERFLRTGVAAHLAALAGSAADPYAVAMVGPRPHLDRTDLRGFLKQMQEPNGSRVLVVSGVDGCGKSHTWFAISDLAERLGSFTARKVDLSQRAGTPAPLADVMQDVAWAMFSKNAPVFDASAQDDTRISRFVAWIANQCSELPKPAWLVFDGFVAECATTDAQKLVTAIAMAADRLEIPQLRVTVLGFSGRSGPDVLSYALRDQPRPPSEEDVHRFFRAVALRSGVTVDDEGIGVLVEQLLEGGDLVSMTMGDIARRCHELARAAFGGDHG